MERKIKELEEKVSRLESILFNLATHKNRCKYIYIQDLLDTMERHGLIITTKRYKKKV